MRKHNFVLENWRALACLFVVFYHLPSLNNDDLPMRDLLFYLFGDSTFYFVFISGALFWSVDIPRYRFARFIRNKATRVLLPYACVGLPIALFRMWYSPFTLLHDLGNFEYVLWSMLTGGALVHEMWYVPMSFVLFLFAPLFVIGLKSRWAMHITVMLMAVTFFTPRPFHNLNPVLSALHFAGVFAAGAMYGKYQQALEIHLAGERGKLVLIALLLLYGGLFFIASSAFDQSDVFYELWGQLHILSVCKMVQLAALLVALHTVLARPMSWLSIVARRSYAIYLISGAVSVAFGFMAAKYGLYAGWVSLLLEFALILAISWLLVELCKLVLKERSKYVIGY